VHRPSSSTCPGWSDLHWASARQSAQSQGTSRLSQLSGAPLGFVTRSNVDFAFGNGTNFV
jgi:hypothetical protein